jgi:hypothetical protein
MKKAIYIIVVVWLLIESNQVFRVIKCFRNFYGDIIHVNVQHQSEIHLLIWFQLENIISIKTTFKFLECFKIEDLCHLFRYT